MTRNPVLNVMPSAAPARTNPPAPCVPSAEWILPGGSLADRDRIEEIVKDEAFPGADVQRAGDVYTGRKIWEVELSEEALDRGKLRSARHRQWGPGASLSPTTELVALPDAIYLSDGTTCLAFDAATGESTKRIDLPDDLETPWANLRVAGDYLVGSNGQHVLCMNRGTGEDGVVHDIAILLAYWSVTILFGFSPYSEFAVLIDFYVDHIGMATNRAIFHIALVRSG